MTGDPMSPLPGLNGLTATAFPAAGAVDWRMAPATRAFT